MPTKPRRPAHEISVRAAMGLYFARRMGPPLLAVAAYTTVAAMLVRWDMMRHDEATYDLGEALYAMYTQLFFEPTEDLPRAPIARALFWVTPLVGALLIFEGILKVGASLFDGRARREIWVRIVSEKMQGHVVLIGLGHVGYRVLEELRRLGTPIVAIEAREQGSFVETVRTLEIPVIVGDARRDELLERAGVPRAAAVVCATDDDLVNLEVALDAKRMKPDIRVVMRMFDQRLASKLGGALELDQVFSTSALVAPLVALQATEHGVQAAYRLDDGETRVTASIEVGSRFEPKRVEELEDRMDGRILRVRHEGDARAQPAKAKTTILPGDELVVDARVDDLAWVRGLLSGS